MIYVVGHKNPDTDSIVSAIAFANLEPQNQKEYVAARSGEINKETEYVLKRFELEAPAMIPAGEKKVILVDHNSPEEGPDDLKPEEVVGIFDHHRLGAPVTADPVLVRVYPYGCTATIAAKVFKEKGITPEKNLAGALIAAILSDTLKFTSPTTTEEDKKAVEELNQAANVDIDELVTAMFAAKSDISDVSTAELLGKDYKVFTMSGKKVGIGVYETVLPQTILERKVEILEKLAERKTAEGMDLIFFAGVDILGGNSDLYIVGDAERKVAEAVWGGTVSESILPLAGVVSRKKQIVPPLENYLSN